MGFLSHGFFFKGKKIVLASGRECVHKGWKRDGKGQKKNQIFFTARGVVQWIDFTTVRALDVQSRTVSLTKFVNKIFHPRTPEVWWLRQGFVTFCLLLIIKRDSLLTVTLSIHNQSEMGIGAKQCFHTSGVCTISTFLSIGHDLPPLHLVWLKHLQFPSCSTHTVWWESVRGECVNQKL